ncbi:hypothetical protein EMIT0P12_70018 [Pseudomonas sp. IT-P12]
MQGAAKKWVVIGNQDFVCGHFSNDPVLQTAQGAATERHPQGAFNASYVTVHVAFHVRNAAYQISAAP